MSNFRFAGNAFKISGNLVNDDFNCQTSSSDNWLPSGNFCINLLKELNDVWTLSEVWGNSLAIDVNKLMASKILVIFCALFCEIEPAINAVLGKVSVTNVLREAIDDTMFIASDGNPLSFKRKSLLNNLWENSKAFNQTNRFWS